MRRKLNNKSVILIFIIAIFTLSSYSFDQMVIRSEDKLRNYQIKLENLNVEIESFNSIIPLSGIILTKMDGTAKGGIALSILEKKSIPINFIGLGEKIDDLIPFNLKDYVMSVLGKERLKNNVS